MTRDEIERLEGRELDMAVGVALFDLAVNPRYEGIVPGRMVTRDGFPLPCPPYSTSWAAMGSVIEAMRQRGWDYCIDGRAEDQDRPVFAYFQRPRKTSMPYGAVAATVPLAVARAAYIAVTKEAK